MGMLLVAACAACRQSRGSVGHDQCYTGGNKAVGNGGAGSGIALCILEVEGDVLAKGSGQGILKALRSGIQCSVLHQLADANGELFSVGSRSDRCRSNRGGCCRRRCGGRTAAGRKSSCCTAGSGSSQEGTTSDFTHIDDLLYLQPLQPTGRRTPGRYCKRINQGSLYTREVYHRIAGKTIHFCPKTAFIIDSSKVIHQLF